MSLTVYGKPNESLTLQLCSAVNSEPFSVDHESQKERRKKSSFPTLIENGFDMK